MINLYQLQIFVAVSERGTFSAAAEQFNLTQPGISQHIRSLEETYKVLLFNRNGPRIELTEAGQRLLEAARPLVRQAEHLEENFSAGLGEVRGRVTLVYSRNTTAGLYRLPPLLAEFHQRYTGVRFSLEQTREETALEMLLERAAQFALLSHQPRQKALESFLLHSDKIVIVLPPQHPWNQQTIPVSQLKGQPFLLRPTGSETRRLAEGALRASGLSLNDLNIVAEVDSVDAIILCVQAGLGLSFASETVVRAYADTGRVGYAQIKLSENAKVDLRREIYLSRLTMAPVAERSPSQDRFWEFIQAHQLPTVN